MSQKSSLPQPTQSVSRVLTADNMWSMWIKYSLTEPVEPVTPFARPKIEPARGRNPHTGHEKWQIFVIYCDGRPSRRSVVAMSSVAWNTR